MDSTSSYRQFHVSSKMGALVEVYSHLILREKEHKINLNPANPDYL
jgi:hypothetical protein